MSYDKRQPLPCGFAFELIEETSQNHYTITTSEEIGRGGSCIVYCGAIENFVGQEHVDKTVIIKEFYPKRLDSNIVRNNKKELVFDSDSTRESFELELRNFCKGQAQHIIYASDNPDKALPSLFCSGRGLGTFYAVSDSGIGETLDKIELRDYDILTVLRIAASLCDAINAVHNGRIAYQLYLDCKPSNIFVCGENAYLFDFNTVQPKDRIRFCSYSEGWSAPEQEFNKERTGYATPDLLGFHTDIYSIAAVLFWMLTGKCPSESGFETNKNNFDWKNQVFLKDSADVLNDKQFIDELYRIMIKTLNTDSKSRKEDFSGRDSAIKLKNEIEHLIALAENVPYKNGFETTGAQIEKAKNEIVGLLNDRMESRKEANSSQSKVSNMTNKRKKLKPSRKKLLVILSSLVALLIVGTLIGVGLHYSSTVNICGKRVSKNITELILEDSEISAKDLKIISSLERIRSLSFLDCRFEATVNDLSSLPKSVTGLYIIKCKLDDELLNSLNNEEREIVELNISGNPSVKNPSMLHMKQLKYFTAAHDGITNLDFLENCIYLEKIDVANCMISDINGLKNLTQLTELNLNNNRLNSLKGVEKSAKNIGKLYLENNQFTDVSFLKGMNNLEWLNLSGNSISDISPLYGNAAIIGFDISHNHIKKIDAGKLSLNLRYVDLSYNDLEQFDNTLIFNSKSGVGSLNLAKNPKLTTASFQGKNFGSFDVIDLHGCTHIDLSSLYSCQEIIYLVIDYREDLDFNIINEKLDYTIEESMLYLVDCPLYLQASVKEKVKHVTFITSEETNEMAKIEFEKLLNTDFCYLDYYPYVYWWVNGSFPNRIRQPKR